ncbi:MAG: hypothetical protein ACO1RA_05495 [Planctomycetaceae bacterium]
MRRSSREVAIQSIIFGTLGFRASLEVTVHPRSESLCSQLLPWLEELNLGDQVEEFHREILETPLRKLPRESQTEAYWRGEAASFLGWAIQLCDKPDRVQPVNPGMLVDCLRILQPNARDLISSAILRADHEIADYCTFCLSVRHHLQLSSLDSDGQIVLKRIHHAKLSNLGLNDNLDRQREIESYAAELASSVPHVKGLHVVRALAAEWLLGEEL